MYATGGDITLSGSTFASMASSVQCSANAACNVIISGCTLAEDSYLDISSSYHLFLYSQGITTCAVSNTRFTGMRDAIYKFDDTGEYKIAIANCVFDGITVCVRNLDTDGAANFTITNCVSTDVDLISPLTIADGDTTPTVLQSGISRDKLLTNNTGATTLYGLDDAVVGEEYTIVLGGNDTVAHDDNGPGVAPGVKFLLDGAADLTPGSGGGILKVLIHAGFAKEVSYTAF